MRQNVWVEIGGTLVFGLLILSWLHLVNAPGLGYLLLILLPLYGGIGFCYFRTLQVLRKLGNTTGAVVSHVAQQLRQLRQLMRLYYWSTMLATVSVLGWVGYMAIEHVLPALHVVATGRFLIWGILTALVSYGLTHWLSRRHLQNFYGQHLDRLEVVLCELREGPSAL